MQTCQLPVTLNSEERTKLWDPQNVSLWSKQNHIFKKISYFWFLFLESLDPYIFIDHHSPLYLLAPRTSAYRRNLKRFGTAQGYPGVSEQLGDHLQFILFYFGWWPRPSGLQSRTDHWPESPTLPHLQRSSSLYAWHQAPGADVMHCSSWGTVTCSHTCPFCNVVIFLECPGEDCSYLVQAQSLS